MPRRRLWLGATLLAIGVIAATIGILKNLSPTHFPALMPQCVLHKVTGLHCPGCGGTRAAHLALNGEWELAFRHHAPFILGLPVILALGLAALFSQGLRHRLHHILSKPRTWGLLVALMLLFGFLRNLPFSWTRQLAPPPVMAPQTPAATP